MSEKRFKLNDKGSFILEDGEPFQPLGKVVDLLNEQQATIRKLQDLCGESDGENAKLRIENKKLKAKLKKKKKMSNYMQTRYWNYGKQTRNGYNSRI